MSSNGKTAPLIIGPHSFSFSDGGWTLGTGKITNQHIISVGPNMCRKDKDGIIDVWIRINPDDREEMLNMIKMRYYDSLLRNYEDDGVQSQTLDDFPAYDTHLDCVTYKDLLDTHTKDVMEKQLEE